MMGKTNETEQQRSGAIALRYQGFRELVGYDVAAWREGYAEIELRLRDDHGNRMGITHGGVYMTILDAAMGHAATWCSVPGNRRRCVTISMTTTFMQPADAPVIKAVGTLVSVENRVATCRGVVLGKDGQPLVAALGSFRYARGSDTVEGIPPDAKNPLR
jgi:uncharacterized protein (TIGR00369 family)